MLQKIGKIVFCCLITACCFAANDLPILQPKFNGNDLDRQQIPITLVPVASGIAEPTDIQFFPDQKNVMLVLEKSGTAKAFPLHAGKVVDKFHVVLKVAVNSNSELGLLGLAFHPNYIENHTVVINYTPKAPRNFSRISSWRITPKLRANTEEIILEVVQPYSNHNAGQLAFGADGYLYVGWGDGGSADDPNNYAQDMQTFLGKMLRIDIDHTVADEPYSIPSDNPFVAQKNALPEIWALGLRNPWRYSFDNQQRLIVGDVGQNSWEEIDIVTAGSNMGWNIREGAHCFPPDATCQKAGLTDPIYEYGRADGVSVTGGYVYNGSNPKLAGKYIFGDFGSGRIWALDLPAKYIPNQSIASVHSLGQFDIAISTFGRDSDGNIYLADFFNGIIYKIQ